jgi:hypothetical protein
MAGKIVASTINDDTGVLATQNGMTGIAKAWCIYDGDTQAIKSSFNISSVTRNAAADYTFNFTTAMASANYVSLATCRTVSGVGYSLAGISNSATPTASAIRMTFYLQNSGTSNTTTDNPFACMAVFSS